MGKTEEMIALYSLYPQKKTGVLVSFDSREVEKIVGPALASVGFVSLDQKDWAQAISSKVKMLSVEEANVKVVKQINYSLSTSNHVGKEAILKRFNHYIYVYQSLGAMIYSPFAKDWKLSLSMDTEYWGEAEYFQQFKVIISRYVGLALSKSSLIGFYGFQVRDGAVVMSSDQSEGEFFLVDLKRRELYSSDGFVKLKNPFNIIRLEETLETRPRGMRSEELFSFLMSKSIYFSHSIVSNNVKYHTEKLVEISNGKIFSRSHFDRDKTGLLRIDSSQT
ncbi:MAG: hypothetical protein H6621_12950 [Halobacteriovoraceae bacterium]|nr:hypothetical protein [Halobacteriovoraceae bacterium]MCB9095970.1 hypothetical protein [Halobacteriovoraceae bacterium]